VSSWSGTPTALILSPTLSGRGRGAGALARLGESSYDALGSGERSFARACSTQRVKLRRARMMSQAVS
jgi:hypothetical protein